MTRQVTLQRIIVPAVLISLMLARCSSEPAGKASQQCGAPFDARAWADNGSGSPTPRQREADRLVRCRALQGKTRAQVRRLLGRPDNGFVRSRHWEYMTGPQRGVPIDVEYLDVTFVSRTVRYVAFSNE